MNNNRDRYRKIQRKRHTHTHTYRIENEKTKFNVYKVVCNEISRTNNCNYKAKQIKSNEILLNSNDPHTHTHVDI